jgi:hypothetical protein
MWFRVRCGNLAHASKELRDGDTLQVGDAPSAR